MENSSEKKTPKWVWSTVIAGLPLGLVLFTAISMVLYFEGEKKSEIARLNTRKVELAEVTDLHQKLTKWIAPRHHLLPDGRLAIRQAESLALGTLSPLNSGFRIRRDRGVTGFGELWKGFEVEIPGEGGDAIKWQVMVPYDLDGESLTFGIIMAEYLKENPLPVTVVVRFYPSLFLGEKEPLQFQKEVSSVWVSSLRYGDGSFQEKGDKGLHFKFSTQGGVQSSPETLFKQVIEFTQFLQSK